MGVVFGYTAAEFAGLKTIPLVTPLVSSSGLRSLARNAGVLAGPALLGVAVGVVTFGDPTELRNLIWNGWTYRREFKSIYNEAYLS